MLGGADNPNGELPSYITGADSIDEFPDFFRITLKHRCPFPVTLPSQQVINRTTATAFSPGMKLNYHPALHVP